MTAARVALLQAEELQLGLDAVDDALAHVGGVVVVVVVGSVRCLLSWAMDRVVVKPGGEASERASKRVTEDGDGDGPMVNRRRCCRTLFRRPGAGI